MTSKATMVKKIRGSGVISERTPDLFRRQEVKPEYKGIATFTPEDGKKVHILLEVADTPELRNQGLMYRESLPNGCGMLFTGLEPGAFWMRNCKIPLDIVFIDRAGKVTKRYSMPVDDGATKYPYTHEKAAVELPCGFCAKHGIVPGTSCKWRTWK